MDTRVVAAEPGTHDSESLIATAIPERECVHPHPSTSEQGSVAKPPLEEGFQSATGSPAGVPMSQNGPHAMMGAVSSRWHGRYYGDPIRVPGGGLLPVGWMGSGVGAGAETL